MLYHRSVPTSHRGKFITFEGLDVLVTREPGGTPTGEKIRHVILDSGTTGLAPMAEMALMFASRAQHIHELIAPAVAEGKIVLCDRFTDSTEAYQGGGRKLGSKVVLELHRILCGDLQPDLTVLMDSDVSSSVERARRRNQKSSRNGHGQKDENRFEQESRAFFSRVRHSYMAVARRESDRVMVVDARGTPAQTHAKILEAVLHRFRFPPKVH